MHVETQGVNAETRYVPSAEQYALASTIEDSLAELLPLARLHKSNEEDAATWSGLAEIGIFGISAAEARDGSGLGATEEALLVMALGRRLAAPAVYATIGAAHLPGEAAARRELQACVAAAYRNGGRSIVVENAGASFVLLRDDAEATLHATGNDPPRPVEQRLWLARLGSADALGAPLARCAGPGLLRLRLIDAAALAGIADGAMELAVAYAKQREQFGRPIGSFQAIKHDCANMLTAARCARDQVLYAAVALDEARDDATLQVECALFVAGTAALDNAGRNIQIHGGIGFSDEADPHLFLKRARVQLAIAGGLEAANRRIADISG